MAHERPVSEVARLSRLVDGLLALARADSATPAPQAIDLAWVVQERLDAGRLSPPSKMWRSTTSSRAS